MFSDLDVDERHRHPESAAGLDDDRLEQLVDTDDHRSFGMDGRWRGLCRVRRISPPDAAVKAANSLRDFTDPVALCLIDLRENGDAPARVCLTARARSRRGHRADDEPLRGRAPVVEREAADERHRGSGRR